MSAPIKLLILATISTLSFSCKKTDFNHDGKIDVNQIAKTWVFQGYLKNGDNPKSKILIEEFSQTLGLENRQYSYSFTYKNGSLVEFNQNDYSISSINKETNTLFLPYYSAINVSEPLLWSNTRGIKVFLHA